MRSATNDNRNFSIGPITAVNVRAYLAYQISGS